MVLSHRVAQINLQICMFYKIGNAKNAYDLRSSDFTPKEWRKIRNYDWIVVCNWERITWPYDY